MQNGRVSRRFTEGTKKRNSQIRAFLGSQTTLQSGRLCPSTGLYPLKDNKNRIWDRLESISQATHTPINTGQKLHWHRGLNKTLDKTLIEQQGWLLESGFKKNNPSHNLIKATYEKHTANIILNYEGLNVFLWRSGRRQGYSLLALLFNIVLEVLIMVIRWRNEWMNEQISKQINR